MSKQPFVVTATDSDAKTVTYEAGFWDGPITPDQRGRYVLSRHTEQWCDRKEYMFRGVKHIWHGRPLSTAPSVSYFDRLLRAFEKIGCRP